MLQKKQINEIKKFLEESQNPLFFFDNDADGWCSFLLLRRFVGRGYGVVIKSYPSLNEKYISRIKEFNPDSIFILDKPLVSDEFLDYAKSRNINTIWIDHHGIQNPKGVHYYNPLAVDGKSEPVSYLCYKIVNQDEWISMLGCLGDYYIPDFFEKVSKEYPLLLPNKKDANYLRYESEFGKLLRIFEFSLKDKTTNVMRIMRALLNVKSPYDIFKREKPFEIMWKRYEEVNKKYQKFIGKAKKCYDGKDKILFFKYSSDMSLSAEISNELAYFYPDKLVIVAKVYGSHVKLSLRYSKKDLREMLKKIFREIEGYGGGHEKACGAGIKEKDLDKFMELMRKQL